MFNLKISKVMKVKDLKAILEGCDDEMNVIVVDCTDKGLQIVGGGELSGGSVCLRVRQEFPDAWYQFGEEVHWIAGKAVILNNKEEEGVEIMVSDEKLFGTKDDTFLYLDFKDGIAEGDGVRMTYPKLADLTDDDIEKINEYCGGRIADSGCIVPYDVALLFGKIEVFGIMDTTNSHDENLVREINRKWVRFREHFKPILCALYERDIDEITDADSFQIPTWIETKEYNDGVRSGDWSDYNSMALRDMRERWELFANNYLMHIADGQDLETICTFVRYDVCEKWS